MESKPFCWILLSLLILSCFVSQTHKKMQGQTLGYLHNSTLKKSSGFDMSFFGAIDNFNETNVHPQVGLKEKDRIERLPGQTQVNFSQYGGYVTVDKSAGRALYYYFVEAQHSKDSLPLLLWLNGGPGCSSLAYGAMQELGPFRVHSDGKTLYKNKFSWNYAVNVLFLESPAGVRFSYSNTTKDYSMSGDRRTAGDNYVFLLNWLKRFPEYKNRDFYVAGESYAGHYVPQLVHTILFHNKKANKTIINLKWIIVSFIPVNDRNILIQYWPNMYGRNEDFWGREYEKHGSCVDPFYSDQLTYFVTAHRVATSTDLYSILLAAGIRCGNSTTVRAVRTAIHASTGFWPTVQCNKSKTGTLQLFQIYLCFNKMTNMPMNCPKVQKGCIDPIDYPWP